MTRLTSREKEEIEQRINRGESLHRIHTVMQLSKTTVYCWYRKMKGRRYTPAEITPDGSREEGEGSGIFAGDGSATKGTWTYDGYICFGLKNQQYAEYVERRYETFFNRPFRIVAHAPWTTKIRFHSKAIYCYFHERLAFTNAENALTVHLKSLDHSEDFLMGFLKGLIDTDGSVFAKGNCLSIKFYTSSPYLKCQICTILTRLSTSYRVYAYLRDTPNIQYHISLRTKKIAFLELIHPYKKRVQWG